MMAEARTIKLIIVAAVLFALLVGAFGGAGVSVARAQTDGATGADGTAGADGSRGENGANGSDTTTTDSPERPRQRPSLLKPDSVARPSDIKTRAQMLREKAHDVQNATQEREDAVRKQMDAQRNGLQERTTDARARMEDRQENRDEKRIERRGRLDEARKHRIRAYVERLLKRFRAAIERLEKIAGRVDSRIEKLKERGVDVSEPERLLTVAREKLTAARQSVGDVVAVLERVLESDTPKDSFHEVRAAFESAKNSIKEAHAALVGAIRALKASVRVTDDVPDDSDDSID